MTTLTKTLTALLLSAAFVPAFAQPASPHATHTAPAVTAQTHANMDMKTMMKDMNDQMANMPMSGDPDVDFAMMMRIHHVGAIDMAKAQLRDGKSPQMRKMAQDIISAQNKEIAVFDKFLASKGHAMDKPKK